MSPERKARSKAYGTAGKMADRATPKVSKQRIGPDRSAKAPGRINLRAVAEVLASKGLDPTEEILKLMEPPTHPDGSPVMGQDGKPMRPALDADVRARLWNELLQYTQPKLRSVDVKVKGAVGTFDVNDEQARKIAEEYLRAAGDEAEGDD